MSNMDAYDLSINTHLFVYYIAFIFNENNQKKRRKCNMTRI